MHFLSRRMFGYGGQMKQRLRLPALLLMTFMSIGLPIWA